MKKTEETVMASFECGDQDLLPHMPYILQDFWEIGSCPETIVATR